MTRPLPTTNLRVLRMTSGQLQSHCHTQQASAAFSPLEPTCVMPAIRGNASSAPSHEQDDSPKSSRPWASGRVLTMAQRERKRRVDRLKQKQRRHRNSLLVNDLKAQVDDLSVKLTSLEPGIPATTSTLEARHTSEFPPAEASLTTSPHYAISQPDLTLVDGSGPEPSCLHSLAQPDVVSEVSPYATGQLSYPILDQRLQQYQPDCDQSNAKPYCTIQNNLNHLVHQACVTERQYICTDELLNQDALIRGIIHGWHTVSSLACYCPLLVVIRQFDECIFSHNSIITRFCTLRMIHYMLLVCRRSELWL
jgi:hypothetical protein